MEVRLEVRMEILLRHAYRLRDHCGPDCESFTTLTREAKRTVSFNLTAVSA